MCRHEASPARSSLSFAVYELNNECRQDRSLFAMRHLLDSTVGDTADRPCLIWLGIFLQQMVVSPNFKGTSSALCANSARRPLTLDLKMDMQYSSFNVGGGGGAVCCFPELAMREVVLSWE